MNEQIRGGGVRRKHPQPYRVRLPGFVSEEEVGLGQIIKRATSSIGIRPCDGCGQRAVALDNWLVVSGSGQK